MIELCRALLNSPAIREKGFTCLIATRRLESQCRIRLMHGIRSERSASAGATLRSRCGLSRWLSL